MPPVSRTRFRTMPARWRGAAEAAVPRISPCCGFRSGSKRKEQSVIANTSTGRSVTLFVDHLVRRNGGGKRGARLIAAAVDNFLVYGMYGRGGVRVLRRPAVATRCISDFAPAAMAGRTGGLGLYLPIPHLPLGCGNFFRVERTPLDVD